MNVHELTPEQLDFLRQEYNYTMNNSTSYVDADDIPDSEIFAAFEGIEFTSDDFPG